MRQYEHFKYNWYTQHNAVERMLTSATIKRAAIHETFILRTIKETLSS